MDRDVLDSLSDKEQQVLVARVQEARELRGRGTRGFEDRLGEGWAIAEGWAQAFLRLV